MIEIEPWGGAPEGVRLAKVLANAGVASRRVIENMIDDGRIEVNGEIVSEQGVRIDPVHDTVMVDGLQVQLDQSKRYLMLNKPVGVVSSMADEQGRADLREFTDRIGERVYNVGRLDRDTSGLIVLTNDGELANVLAHPRFGVTKTYVAKVAGRMTARTVQELRYGIELDDGPIAADSARIVQTSQAGGGSSLVEITLHSGRNRIVRRMLAEVGHPVRELVRRSFGPLHLGTLRPGAMRDLTREELGQVFALADDAQAEQSRPAARHDANARNDSDSEANDGIDDRYESERDD